MAVSANRLELLQIADAVAREKAIDRMIVVAAMEDAIQKAARQRYGSETDVRAEINPKTGEIKLQRLLKVVDANDNAATDILLEDARHRNPAAQLGDFIAEPLPPMTGLISKRLRPNSLLVARCAGALIRASVSKLVAVPRLDCDSTEALVSPVES